MTKAEWIPLREALFRDVPDPRRPEGERHPLPAVLALRSRSPPPRRPGARTPSWFGRGRTADGVGRRKGTRAG